jgi:hypothetical protein
MLAVAVVALVAVVPREPAVPVRAQLVLVRLPVLADLLLGPAVLVPEQLALLVQVPVPAAPPLVQQPVPAAPLLAQVLVLVQVHPEPVVRAQVLAHQVHLAREAAVPLQRLLSRR